MAVEFSDFQRLAWYYQALIVVGLAGGLLAGFWYQFLTPIEDEIVAKEAQVIHAPAGNCRGGPTAAATGATESGIAGITGTSRRVENGSSPGAGDR